MARSLVSADIPDSVSQKVCVYVHLEAEAGTEMTQRRQLLGHFSVAVLMSLAQVNQGTAEV